MVLLVIAKDVLVFFEKKNWFLPALFAQNFKRNFEEISTKIKNKFCCLRRLQIGNALFKCSFYCTVAFT